MCAHYCISNDTDSAIVYGNFIMYLSYWYDISEGVLRY